MKGRSSDAFDRLLSSASDAFLQRFGSLFACAEISRSLGILVAAPVGAKKKKGKNMRKLAIAMALSTSLLASPAMARDGAFYNGAEFGPMIVEVIDFD